MPIKVSKTIKLSSGYYIPTVGLGTWETPRSLTANIVYEALKAGYRHVDCASLYGNEAECGEGIMKWVSEGNDRKEVFYTTKLWDNENGYENAKRAIKKCLERVSGLGYIDLLLIHSPLEGPKMRIETYRAMQEAVDEGLVKSIGVSNYGTKHVDELLAWDGLKYKPVVNQIEISPWLMRQELADYCVERGIEVEAYAPLGKGAKITHPIVKRIADAHGVSGAQVLIRWSLQKGHIALPKTQTVARLASNLDVYSFELSDAELKELDHPQAYEPTDWECTDAP